MVTNVFLLFIAVCGQFIWTNSDFLNRFSQKLSFLPPLSTRTSRRLKFLFDFFLLYKEECGARCENKIIRSFVRIFSYVCGHGYVGIYYMFRRRVRPLLAWEGVGNSGVRFCFNFFFFCLYTYYTGNAFHAVFQARWHWLLAQFGSFLYRVGATCGKGIANTVRLT